MANNVLLVNHTGEQTRVAVIEDGLLTELYIESASERRIVGNIYKGRVLKVLPGMNAAFVDVGLERTAFLYAYDVLPDRHAPEEDGTAPQSDIHVGRPDRGEVRIETLLREGQEVLVQVSKEPMGTKGARLTCNLALPGIFAVFLPTVEHVGVSRKIEDPEERKRLRDMGDRVTSQGHGMILRTVAEGRTPEEIGGEIDFLVKLWAQVRQGAAAVDPPALIHEDLNLLLRTARDLICRRFDRMVIDSPEGARSVENFLRRFLASPESKIELYTGKQPLFESRGIEVEISRALQRKVWLRSGGYLVIERAEAFTAVDVNSGKFTGKDDPEETILKTNLEAAEEIAYQLRLRDIGGIIVIDFIDMRDRENRRLVQETVVRELKKDHARTRVLPMSDLGLIEMTRRRVTESVVTQLTEPCFYCEGKGYLKSPQMICHTLFAKIEKEVRLVHGRTLHVHANPKVVSTLMELYGPGLERLEKRTRRSIVLTERESFHIEHYEVFADA